MSAGVNAEALDADGAALAAAGSLAEEALALHRDALTLLDDGWRSQSGSAATDLLRLQCGEGAELVAALHDAAAECRALCDAAEYPVGAVADQTFSRIGDRPAARFGAPDPTAFGSIAAPSPQPPPAWTPTPVPASALPAVPAPAAPLPAAPALAVPSPALPDLGGALVGLVAQIADAMSLESAGDSVDPGDNADLATEAATEAASEAATGQRPSADEPERPAPPLPATPSPPSATPSPPPATASPPPATPQVPAVDPPVLLPITPADQLQPAPPLPPPDPPLLAAERPPDPPADPVAPPAEDIPEQAPAGNPDTPCEIAADALPQVGG